MKRVPFYLLALSIIFSGIAFAVPNDDTTGPEGDTYGSGYFQMFVDAGNAPTLPTSTIKETLRQTFNLADGWDFGERAAYRCAWIEYFQGSNEKFEVSYYGVSNYTGSFQINDKFGAQLAENTKPACWAGVSADNGATFVHDGSDHFPHMN